MSKLLNSVCWSFVGLILTIGGFIFYINGYKPIIFTIGILVMLYRAVTTHTDEYEPGSV